MVVQAWELGPLKMDERGIESANDRGSESGVGIDLVWTCSELRSNRKLGGRTGVESEMEYKAGRSGT